MSANLNCPYCGTPAVLIDSIEVYGNGRSYGLVWVCSNRPQCDARVGCHPHSSHPLGTLANWELRAARSAAHQALDCFWKGGIVSRTAAYLWLSRALNISPDECHIGTFDLAVCDQAIKVCEAMRSHIADLFNVTAVATNESA